MKKKLIKAGVLLVVFAAALVVSSFIINRGSEDQIADMGAPAIPRVWFTVNGQKVNILSGYVRDMDIPAMRDTITPLEADGTLDMTVEEDGNAISGVKYTVYSMDGEEVYGEGEASELSGEETVTLSLADSLEESVREAVLKIVLTVDDREVSYYTRIERSDNINAADCLAYAQDFHTNALEKTNAEEMELRLEPNEESDNTTYQTVNIHSDITHIQWGSLDPQLIGEVEWSIKESNSVYTSILAKYQVSCADDNEETGIITEICRKSFPEARRRLMKMAFCWVLLPTIFSMRQMRMKILWLLYRSGISGFTAESPGNYIRYSAFLMPREAMREAEMISMPSVLSVWITAVIWHLPYTDI